MEAKGRERLQKQTSISHNGGRVSQEQIRDREGGQPRDGHIAP